MSTNCSGMRLSGMRLRVAEVAQDIRDDPVYNAIAKQFGLPIEDLADVEIAIAKNGADVSLMFWPKKQRGAVNRADEPGEVTWFDANSIEDLLMRWCKQLEDTP